MDMILDEIIDDHKLVKGKSTNNAAAKSIPKSNVPESAGEDHQDVVDVLLQLQESGELQFELTTNHIKAVTLVIKYKVNLVLNLFMMLTWLNKTISFLYIGYIFCWK